MFCAEPTLCSESALGPVRCTLLRVQVPDLAQQLISQGNRFVTRQNGHARGPSCRARSAVSIAARRNPHFTTPYHRIGAALYNGSRARPRRGGRRGGAEIRGIKIILAGDADKGE